MQRTDAMLVTALVTALVIVTTACTDLQSFAGPGHSHTKDGADEITAGPSSAADPGLPCDVDKVLGARCRQCHGASPIAGASTSLMSYDDLNKTFKDKKVSALVGERIHDQARQMPPGNPLQ